MDKAEIRRVVCKLGLKLYDHRDDIAFVGGTVLSIVGTALFVKKTFKQVEINKEHEEAKEAIENSDISEEEKDEAIKKNNRETLGKTVKNYAVPAMIELVAIGASGYGYSVKNSKYAGMALAYNGLSAMYNAFRANVAADVGEEKCLEYEHGITLGENAESTEVTKNDDMYSRINGQRTFVFDRTNRFFNPSRGANDDMIAFLTGNLKRRIKNDGFTSLPNALDMFGFNLMSEITIDGKRMRLIHFINPNAGWVWKDKNGGKDHEPLVHIVSRSGDGEDERIILKFNCVDDFRVYL